LAEVRLHGVRHVMQGSPPGRYGPVPDNEPSGTLSSPYDYQ